MGVKSICFKRSALPSLLARDIVIFNWLLFDLFMSQSTIFQYVGTGLPVLK